MVTVLERYWFPATGTALGFHYDEYVTQLELLQATEDLLSFLEV